MSEVVRYLGVEALLGKYSPEEKARYGWKLDWEILN
jgi:hypothetical protein